MVSIVSKPQIAVQRPNSILGGLQRAQEEELRIASQNLSNAMHPGYKAFVLDTEQQDYHTKDKQKISYVKITGSHRDMTSGSINMTQSPLDFALTGKGYFMIQTDQGIRFTRNGRFFQNPEGFLVTHNGNFVLDENQSPIMAPKNINHFKVSSSGNMSVHGMNIGKLGIVTFDNEDNMRLQGNSLLHTDEEPQEPDHQTVFTQGGYEESNVSYIDVSVKLIEIRHRFEDAQKMIDAYSELQKNTINAKAQL